MRLLLLTADYAEEQTWSGIGVAVANQALALAGLGIETHVISVFLEDSTTTTCNPRLHRLRGDSFPLEPRRSDIVHLHSLSLAALACELKRRYRLTLVYTAHSLVALELSGTSECAKWSLVQARIFSLADKVLFLSDEERATACSIYSGLERRSAVLPNGVNECVAPHQGIHRTRTAIFVGRLTRNKGVDIFANTVRRLIDRGCDWDFVIAGGHGEPESLGEVRSLAKRSPGRCRFTGWLGRAALDRLYSCASLALIPSRYEPFCMVALEAMSRGVPVLASAVGGLRRIVGPASGGCIVDQNQSWISSCETLMSAPETRELLSLQGPSYVTQHFDATRLARQYLAELGFSV